MPQVVVGAVVALGAATVVTTTAAIAIGIVTAIALPALIKKLTPNLETSNKSNQELGVGTPRSRIIVGQHVVSGAITKYEKVSHDGKEWHHMFIPLCSHASESVELYQLDGKQNRPMTGNGYRIEARLGDQTSVLYRAKQMMSSVDNSFIGHGYTDVYCEFAIDADIFPNGLQDLKFLVKGIKIYDPRKDSTVGGVGDHRFDDPATWEWTQNAALINFFWKRFYSEAQELPLDMFDMDNIAEEANICDEQVDDGNGGTHARYTCDGVIDLSLGTESVEDNLLSSCGGTWVEVNGGFELKVAAWRGPEVLTITDDDLTGSYDESPHLGLRERVNTLACNYISEEHFYQATDTPPVVSEYLKNNRDNGVELNDDFPAPFTTNGIRVQRLAVIKIEELALGRGLSLPLGKKTLLCKPKQVVRVILKSGIDGLFEVLASKYDWEDGTGTVELKETAPEIYNSSITPLPYDPSPNVVVDNTLVSVVSNIGFQSTPEDGFRSGTLTWQHPVPTSVTDYIVRVFTGTDTDLVFSANPDSQSVDVPNLPVGDYTVYIQARNLFRRLSDEVSFLFSITHRDSGAVGNEGGDFLFFEPASIDIELPYYFEFYFDDVDHGQPPHNEYRVQTGLALDVASNITPNRIYFLWYRAIINATPGTWNTRQIQAGQGLSVDGLNNHFATLVGRLEESGDINNSLASYSGELARMKQTSRNLLIEQAGQIASDLDSNLNLSERVSKHDRFLLEIDEEVKSLKLEAGVVSPNEVNAISIRVDTASARIESITYTQLQQAGVLSEHTSTIAQHSQDITLIQQTLGNGSFDQLSVRLDSIDNSIRNTALSVQAQNYEAVAQIAADLDLGIELSETQAKLAYANSQLQALSDNNEQLASQYSVLLTTSEQGKAIAESLVKTVSNQFSQQAQKNELLSAEIVQEGQTRQSQIDSVTQAISDETSSRASQYESLSTSIEDEVSTRQSQIETVTQSISDESSTRATQFTSLNSKVDLQDGETVTAKITEQLDLNIGYCTVQYDSQGNRIVSQGQCQAAGGSWVSGTLAQILDNIQIQDSAGNPVSLTQALQAITDESGNILASGAWLFDANDRVTGIRQTRNINGENTDVTIIEFINDILRFVRASDGQVMLEANNETGFLVTRYHQIYLPDGSGLASEADFRAPIIELEYLDGNTFTQKSDGTYDGEDRRVAVRVYLGGRIIDTALVIFNVDSGGVLSWEHLDSQYDDISVETTSNPDDVDMQSVRVSYSGEYNGVQRTSSWQGITMIVRRFQAPITSAIRTIGQVSPSGWTALARFTVPLSPNWRTFRLEPFTVLLPNSGTQTLSYNFRSTLNGAEISTKSFSVVGTDPTYTMSTPLFIDLAPNLEWGLTVSVTGSGVIPAGTEIRVTQVPDNVFTGNAMN